MSNFFKVFAIIAVLVMAITMLAACGEKNENPDILAVAGATRESLTESLKAKEGSEKGGKLVKEMIYDIIDYNNSHISDALVISFRETEYREVEDLNLLSSLIDEDETYNIELTYDGNNIKEVIIIQNIVEESGDELLIIDEDAVLE